MFFITKLSLFIYLFSPLKQTQTIDTNFTYSIDNVEMKIMLNFEKCKFIKIFIA